MTSFRRGHPEVARSASAPSELSASCEAPAAAPGELRVPRSPDVEPGWGAGVGVCVASPPSGRRLPRSPPRLSPCLRLYPSCISFLLAEIKGLLPKPGLASPGKRDGLSRLRAAGGARPHSELLQPGPARSRWLRVSPHGSGLGPLPAIPGCVTRWSLAPGMRLPRLGSCCRGGFSSSCSSPLLTKTLPGKNPA